MGQVNIVIPSVGESISEANIGKLVIPSGAWVEKGKTVLEIETDKASVEVTAPESGLVSYSVATGDLVKIGAVAGQIDTSGKAPALSTPAAATSTAAAATAPKSAQPAPTNGAHPPAADYDLQGLGPAQRKAIREGKAPAPNSTASKTTAHSLDHASTNTELVPMSVIRKKIAQRLLESQHGTASLTTFNEVDMSKVLATRNQIKTEFEKKHGVKLGFMSYFAKAVCHAAQAVPVVNAQIQGDNIVYHKNMHISVAVSTERGLVVPVLRSANHLSYAEIEKGIGALAEKARIGKLGIEDMMGGSFTITNGGVFGSLLSTPILNPPQSGILGMHKIEQRPMAIDDGSGNYKVEVRPMMYLALTYDHRLIDGKDSVAFLVKCKEYLESVTAEMIN